MGYKDQIDKNFELQTESAKKKTAKVICLLAYLIAKYSKQFIWEVKT